MAISTKNIMIQDAVATIGRNLAMIQSAGADRLDDLFAQPVLLTK